MKAVTTFKPSGGLTCKHNKFQEREGVELLSKGLNHGFLLGLLQSSPHASLVLDPGGCCFDDPCDHELLFSHSTMVVAFFVTR